MFTLLLPGGRTPGRRLKGQRREEDGCLDAMSLKEEEVFGGGAGVGK